MWAKQIAQVNKNHTTNQDLDIVYKQTHQTLSKASQVEKFLKILLQCLKKQIELEFKVLELLCNVYINEHNFNGTIQQHRF